MKMVQKAYFFAVAIQKHPSLLWLRQGQHNAGQSRPCADIQTMLALDIGHDRQAIEYMDVNHPPLVTHGGEIIGPIPCIQQAKVFKIGVTGL